MKRFVTFSLLLAVPLSALTLDEAVRRGLENNPGLLQKAYAKDSAESDRTAARASFLPSLDGGYSVTKLEKTTAFSKESTSVATLSASLNLFNGMGDYYTYQSAKEQEKAAELQYEAARADLALAIKEAFIACLLADRNLQNQEASVALLKRQYDDASVQFEQGMIPKNTLLQIEVQLLATQQEALKAKSERAVNRSALATLLGGNLPKKEPLDEPDLPAALELNTIQKETLQNRRELRALQAQLHSLEAQKSAVFGGHLPRVDLGVSYQKNDEEITYGGGVIQPLDQTATTLNVSWKLFEGGARSAQSQKLLAAVRSAQAALTELNLALEHQLNSAVEAYTLAKNSLEVAQKAHASAVENYRITRELYTQGAADNTELLDARAELTKARSSRDAARYALLLSHATLLRISGKQ